ncbi:MAG: dipeptidyl-peptidase-4 [Flavobacteriales bacterium]|jgi:dipeptidyl-peptidase-4
MIYAQMIKKTLVLGLILSMFTGNISAQEKLTNEKIWYSGEFSASYVSGINSMKNGIHYTSLDFEEGNMIINKYDYRSSKKLSTVLSSADLMFQDEKVQISGYQFSADEKKLLISSAVEGIYRHSSQANYFVYDLSTKLLKPLSDFSKGKQRLAEFSPNGNLIAFVRENNLFVVDIATAEEVQITSDGSNNNIINGGTDWVYEEEFGFDKGFYWSPKGTKIAFYKFDESKVKQFQMATYGGLYPDQYTFKYPKAGEDNSIVSIHMYDVVARKTYDCPIGDETNIYIPRITWTANDNVLAILRLNRLQNHVEYLAAKFNPKIQELTSEVIYEERSETYLEINDDVQFLNDGKYFVNTSERSGFNHIYLYNMKGEIVRQLTKGKYDVTSIKGIDQKKKLVYYRAAEANAMERHVFSIGLNGRGKKNLTPKKGTNDANFSSSFKYFINFHSDANTPYNISLHDYTGKKIKTLKDNKKLKETIAKYNFGKKEFFNFNTAAGINLNGWMIKPANFNENKEYPVFMTMYNGPGINQVNDSWGSSNFLWHQLLAQEGYIVVCVDGRGTGYRGSEFKKCTYLQLGKYETEDQIATGVYLGNLPYVDKNRIGVQGWSYGGYMSSLCMTKGADVFKAGIAVAPVTNWRYYDNIYTERFMRTPQENGDNYDDNSPINHVDKLKGAYLLVHGSADDNVHYQNTMEMVNALVKANKQFDLFIYPDKNHGIYGGTTRLHLFTKMTNFLKQNL